MAADGPRHAGAITELLHAVEQGDSLARRHLWDLVYGELRQLAHRQALAEKRALGPHTTMLVHEAYLRLVDNGEADVHWHNRRHFFAAAAQAMRRIRVDDARTRARLKRGGPGLVDGSGRPARPGTPGQVPRRAQPAESVADPRAGDDDPLELLALDEALTKLEQVDARKAEVVMLRFFAGMTVEQTASAMGIAPRTVDNLWRVARAWLHRELDGDRR